MLLELLLAGLSGPDFVDQVDVGDVSEDFNGRVALWLPTSWMKKLKQNCLCILSQMMQRLILLSLIL